MMSFCTNFWMGGWRDTPEAVKTIRAPVVQKNDWFSNVQNKYVEPVYKNSSAVAVRATCSSKTLLMYCTGCL